MLVEHQKHPKVHHPQMIFAQISTTQYDTFIHELVIPKTNHPKMIFSKISTTQRDALVHNVVDHQHNQIWSNTHATDLSASNDVEFSHPLSMRGQNGNLCPERSTVQVHSRNVHGVPSHSRQKLTVFCSRRRQKLLCACTWRRSSSSLTKDWISHRIS